VLFIENFAPTWRARSVIEITPEFLVSNSIRALLLDRDGTLTETDSILVESKVLYWVKLMKRAGVRLAIVSNAFKLSRVMPVAEVLGIDCVVIGFPYLIGKPRPEILLEALRILDVQVEQALMVGDQLLTDILAGNLAGTKTLLVEPLSRRAKLGTKLLRYCFETRIKSRLAQEGKWPPYGVSI